MKDQDELKEMLSKMNKEEQLSFLEKAYANLDNLYRKENKYSLWLILILFIYFFVDYLGIKSFNLGFISLDEITVFPKILPLFFLYSFISLKIINSQINNTAIVLKILTETTIFEKIKCNKGENFNLLKGVYLPYNFSIAIEKFIPKKKPNIVESFIGFVLFFPVIFISLIPYIAIFRMLYNLWFKYSDDTLAIICFWLTLWTFIILIFYIVKDGIQKNFN